MIKLFDKKIPQKEIILFFRQLTTLINANIAILESLELLQKSQKNILLKNIIIDSKALLERGNYLSSTLRNFPQYFDTITCHLLTIGEKSGTFPWVLEQITYQKEKQYQIKHKIIQALFYPTIVMTVAIIIFFIMLIFIVPEFNQLFQDMNTSIPSFTKSILDLSSLLRCHGLFLLAICYLTIMSITSLPFSIRPHQLLTYLPFYQRLLKNISIIYFSRYLSITLKAGLPISEAISLINNSTLNSTFQQELTLLKASIEKGEKIHKSMQSRQYFSDILIGMIKIGEESGKLEEVLEKISTLYENDINKLISYASNLLEPLIMILLGVLIGALIIAMYLPIFNLGTLM